MPEETEFSTKAELARRTIERALKAGTPCHWVAADEVYGNNSKLRRWLQEQRLGYVMVISSDQRIRWPDRERRCVDAIAQNLPNMAWKRVSAGSGSKSERLYDWTLIRGWEEDGWNHGLLVRRSIEQQHEYAHYWFYAPTSEATLETLARGRATLADRTMLPGSKGRVWTGPLRRLPLAGRATAHRAGHAGSRGAGHPHSASAGRRKLQADWCQSAYRKCATCSLAFSGADGTALSVYCTGRNGEDNTNSLLYAATTGNEDLRRQSTICNGSKTYSLSPVIALKSRNSLLTCRERGTIYGAGIFIRSFGIFQESRSRSSSAHQVSRSSVARRNVRAMVCSAYQVILVPV